MQRGDEKHHVLFEVSVGGPLCESLDAISAEQPKFATLNWPLMHEETRKKLEELTATHCIVPEPLDKGSMATMHPVALGVPMDVDMLHSLCTSEASGAGVWQSLYD